MKWEAPKPKPQAPKNKLVQLVRVLSQLEQSVNATVTTSPLFSEDEKKSIKTSLTRLRHILLDAVKRLRAIGYNNALLESLECMEPDKALSHMDDIKLQTKLARTEADIQYFVSLAITALDRLRLTNHLSRKRYGQHKRVLEYLPRFHADLVTAMKNAS